MKGAGGATIVDSSPPPSHTHPPKPFLDRHTRIPSLPAALTRAFRSNSMAMILRERRGATQAAKSGFPVFGLAPRASSTCLVMQRKCKGVLAFGRRPPSSRPVSIDRCFLQCHTLSSWIHLTIASPEPALPHLHNVNLARANCEDQRPLRLVSTNNCTEHVRARKRSRECWQKPWVRTRLEPHPAPSHQLPQTTLGIRQVWIRAAIQQRQHHPHKSSSSDSGGERCPPVLHVRGFKERFGGQRQPQDPLVNTHNLRAYNNYVGVRARFDQHRLKAFGFQARKCAKQR